MKKIVLFIVLQLFILNLFSQEDKLSYDSTFLKVYDYDYFYPFAYTNVHDHNIYLSNIEKKKGWVNYKPNSPLYLGLGFDYKWLTIAYSFPIHSINGQKGNSFNLFGGMSRRKFRIALMYQQYEGFHLDDSSIEKENKKKNKLYREDIHDYIFQAKIFYFFNHEKVSYLSSFLYSEKQLKSAGSFTTGANFFIAGLSADSSIIPSNLDTSLNKELNKQNALDINLGINFGYMYTWVFWKNYHFSFHFSPTIHFNKDRFIKKIDNKNFVSNLKNSFFMGLDFRSTLGYDNDKYYGGLVFFGTNTKQTLTESSFSSDYTVFELYFGKRLKLGFLKDKKNKIKVN